MDNQYDEFTEGLWRDLSGDLARFMPMNHMSVLDRWQERLRDAFDKVYEMGFLDGHSEGVEDGASGDF